MPPVLDVLQCPECAGTEFTATPTELTCVQCHVLFPIKHGVINALGNPAPDVIQELHGMMVEHGLPLDNVNDFVVQAVDRVSTQAEREESLAGEPLNYYRSTRMNLDQVVALLPLTDKKTVLEVGSENDFPFLAPFQKAGLRCIGSNIYFRRDSQERLRDWPEKVAGDMNRMPFRDGFFDVVLTSATTHHSPTLDQTIREMARVTRPGGYVVIINEPINGSLKHLWDFAGTQFRKGKGREELIHENEYSIGEYGRAFAKHGLRLKHSLFSAFYDETLLKGRTSGVRFQFLATAVSRLWRIRPLRSFLKTRGLKAGQVLFGLEMNVILQKR